jgi:hypothetical protein
MSAVKTIKKHEMAEDIVVETVKKDERDHLVFKASEPPFKAKEDDVLGSFSREGCKCKVTRQYDPDTPKYLPTIYSLMGPSHRHWRIPNRTVGYRALRSAICLGGITINIAGAMTMSLTVTPYTMPQV